MNILLIILFIILEYFLLSDSKLIISSFNNSFNICIYKLMPTLFLSMLINQMLIKLNFERFIPKKLIKKLFNISDKEASIFILSLISGYPNNSKMLIGSSNLNNIILYTNFINPIFLIVTLKNTFLSIIILLSHYLSNIILGIILRKNNISYIEENNINNYSYLNMYYSTLKDIIYTLSIIFSNILLFSIINSLVINIFNFNDIISSIIMGLIEFSSGIYNISITNINPLYKGLIILLIISFSSFSIHMQMISINPKIKYIKYLLFRILNVFISIIIFLLLVLILKLFHLQLLLHS